ncbi:crossover junction endodeoxyribonuclease RuvC [Amnibacterium endophyticum]|uniref:Crossover junction endodeoxyribonuclease RuvC n=1 Tax=Amnibacterium endophyticum TaxID=2109337 RepID=A0ABW4LHR9_9MICO
MTLRVLGVDPGLTRCGVGVVEVRPDRTATLVHVEVLRTPADQALELRLLTIGRGLARLLDEHRPQAFALERVFAQQNMPSVMGVAQISGIALHLAAERSLPIGLHTPSEVKAAVTGYGNADKRQVTAMVARLLGLTELPKPADAADALAIAICHAWRQPQPAASGAPLTPAQRAWRAAEAGSRRR